MPIRQLPSPHDPQNIIQNCNLLHGQKSHIPAEIDDALNGLRKRRPRQLVVQFVIDRQSCLVPVPPEIRLRDWPVPAVPNDISYNVILGFVAHVEEIGGVDFRMWVGEAGEYNLRGCARNACLVGIVYVFQTVR